VLLTMTLLAGGCAAKRPDIDARVYFCDEDGDCGEGWLCAEANAVSRDFCTAECDPDDPASCDGYCTSEGRCLPGCEINLDGSTTRCPEGTACIRLTSSTDPSGTDPGVCFPAHGCTVDDDCPPGWDCPSEDLPPSVVGVLRFDHYYCSPRPEGEMIRCPMGWIRTQINDATPPQYACVPPCGDSSVGGGTIRCPPSTACASAYSVLLEDPTNAACVPGLWGFPCRDQTNCLLGECTELQGGRRVCTYGCEFARQFSPPGAVDPCIGMESLLGGQQRIRCEMDVCVPRQRALSPCDDAFPCVEGYECTLVMLGPDSPRYDACLRRCATDPDCMDPFGAYCLIFDVSMPGVCVPAGNGGDECNRAEMCQSGRCTGGFCDAS
jgi:hypothetical protein